MVYQPHPKDYIYNKKKGNSSKKKGQPHNPMDRNQNPGGPQATVKKVFKYFCQKRGHKKSEYFKYKNWKEKKNMNGDNLLALVCFVSTLKDVLLHSW